MKRSVMELAFAALLTAILFVQQVALSVLPNVHLCAVLILWYTVSFPRLLPLILPGFLLLEGIFYGFGLWWLSYLYIWPLLALAALLLRKKERPASVWAVPGVRAVLWLPVRHPVFFYWRPRGRDFLLDFRNSLRPCALRVQHASHACSLETAAHPRRQAECAAERRGFRLTCARGVRAESDGLVRRVLFCRTERRKPLPRPQTPIRRFAGLTFFCVFSAETGVSQAESFSERGGKLNLIKYISNQY